jgi:hypothetical protein
MNQGDWAKYGQNIFFCWKYGQNIMDLIMINVGGARGGFVWCNLMAIHN